MVDLPPDSGSGAQDGASTIRERDVLDALPRAVVVTDAAGHVVLWNNKAESLYGWNEIEVLGRSIIELLAHPRRSSPIRPISPE